MSVWVGKAGAGMWDQAGAKLPPLGAHRVRMSHARSPPRPPSTAGGRVHVGACSRRRAGRHERARVAKRGCLGRAAACAAAGRVRGCRAAVRQRRRGARAGRWAPRLATAAAAGVGEARGGSVACSPQLEHSPAGWGRGPAARYRVAPYRHFPPARAPRLWRQAGGFAPSGTAALQAGPDGCLLPARYETHDTLVAQLQGRRRVLLVPPEQVCRVRAQAGSRDGPAHMWSIIRAVIAGCRRCCYPRKLRQPALPIAGRPQRRAEPPLARQAQRHAAPTSKAPPHAHRPLDLPPCLGCELGIPWRGPVPCGAPLRRLQLP